VAARLPGRGCVTVSMTGRIGNAFVPVGTRQGSSLPGRGCSPWGVPQRA